MEGILKLLEGAGRIFINMVWSRREDAIRLLANMDVEKFKKLWDNMDRLDASKVEMLKEAAKKRGWKG